MELTQKGLLQKESWQAAGYDLPQFDIPAVTQRTLEAVSYTHLDVYKRQALGFASRHSILSL